MAVEFELPVLHISMAAVDKMQGPGALQALWAVFTKTTGALQDGTRLENMTWRLWHRQLLNERLIMSDDTRTPKEPVTVEVVEVASDDSESNDDWEDDSAPPSRDPVVVSARDSTGTRRQSSTSTLHPISFGTAPRSRPLSSGPAPVISCSQPTSSVRPTLTSESRTNSAPDGPYYQRSSSHGANIGRIISNLLPEKFDAVPPSWALAQPLITTTGQADHIPSTPRTQPAQFLIHAPSTPPKSSDDLSLNQPPTLMVITPTPRPTPPGTPATRSRVVPTNIPPAHSLSTTPPALSAPSTLSEPLLVFLPHPSASDRLVSAAALPLTPTLVGAPDLTEDDARKKIFYVQSPDGATASDDGRSHSSSSNTTSNVTDPHAALGGQQVSSHSSATTNELVVPQAAPEPASPAADASAPHGANHTRSSSGNAAYTRSRNTRGAKASKPPVRLPHRGRPNTLMRTASNSSDKSPVNAKAKPTRQQSVSEEVTEDVEEPEPANRHTSASTSHTVTSLPKVPAPLSMTPAANLPDPMQKGVRANRVVSSPSVRPPRSDVKSPPKMLSAAAPVAPFATLAPTAPAAPAQNALTEAPRPPVNNNSSALLGLGRRTVHVETSSDLDLESDSEELWSDDESDIEAPLVRAANEASRQRSMFRKIEPKPLPRNERTGLLTNLMNPDPILYPQAAYRQHNSAQNLAAGRRGTPTMLQTSRSTVAVPMAATVTAEQITTQVAVDPKGRTVGGSGARGLRLQARPEGEDVDDGSTDEENPISNQLSKSLAQRRLEALANRAPRAPPPSAMQQTRHGEPGARAPATAPRPTPPPPPPPATVPYGMDVRPIHSPRTVRRKMIAGELSESLRRNLMWERTSTRFAMGGGALGSGLRALTTTRPTVTTVNSDRGPIGGARSGDEDNSQQLNEAGRQALARNRSWANDFHHAGW